MVQVANLHHINIIVQSLQREVEVIWLKALRETVME